MAVVTTKAGVITNRDATPRVPNNAAVSGGLPKSLAGFVTAASGDSIGSIYIMGSIPSSARVAAVIALCDAITTCAANVGVYRTTADGGAVVNATFFAAALSLATALTGSDITHAAGGSNTVAKCEMPLWQALGLATDPSLVYDIAYTLTAAAGSGGSVGMKVNFVS